MMAAPLLSAGDEFFVHRRVGEPFAVALDGVAALRLVAAVLEEFLRGVG